MANCNRCCNEEVCNTKHSRGHFLSHLSGDEVDHHITVFFLQFLSHLSGDEALTIIAPISSTFLSYLSGDEVD